MVCRNSERIVKENGDGQPAAEEEHPCSDTDRNGWQRYNYNTVLKTVIIKSRQPFAINFDGLHVDEIFLWAASGIWASN